MTIVFFTGEPQKATGKGIYGYVRKNVQPSNVLTITTGQLAAATCSQKSLRLGTWRGLHGIQFPISPCHIASQTGDFLTSAELARIRGNGPVFWRIR